MNHAVASADGNSAMTIQCQVSTSTFSALVSFTRLSVRSTKPRIPGKLSKRQSPSAYQHGKRERMLQCKQFIFAREDTPLPGGFDNSTPTNRRIVFGGRLARRFFRRFDHATASEIAEQRVNGRRNRACDDRVTGGLTGVTNIVRAEWSR